MRGSIPAMGHQHPVLAAIRTNTVLPVRDPCGTPAGGRRLVPHNCSDVAVAASSVTHDRDWLARRLVASANRSLSATPGPDRCRRWSGSAPAVEVDSCQNTGVDINWVAFVGVVALAYLIPGPDMAVVLRSATRGSRSGAAAVFGAQFGLFVHLLLAVVGLSVVLARHPEVLNGVRIAGGVYLVYLGGRLIVPTLRGADDAARRPVGEVSTRSAFAQGLFTNLLNPKAVLFFAAVLPQFLVPGAVPMWVQVVTLGVLDILLGFIAWAAVVALGVRLATLLRRQRVRQWWDRITGAVLGGVGGGLIVTR